MDKPQNLPETIEVRRGGLAQYFIYMSVFLVFGLLNAVFNIPQPYLYYVFVAIAVLLVMNINTLSAKVFNQVIIRASKEGFWTRKLSLVPWNQIKNIRLDKTSTFNAGNMTSSTSIDLIIETTDSRESVFWGSFLDKDANQLCASLNNFWMAHQKN